MILKNRGFVKGGIEICLPQGRTEVWEYGTIVDDTFPNTESRHSRVTRGGYSPTITATGVSHLFYLERQRIKEER